jgi:general secretion pathway protein K
MSRRIGRRTSPRARQKGVALIIALILVALATMLATKLTFDGFMERQRTVSVLAGDQAMQFGYGAEALAADILTAQTGNTQLVTLADPWAQPTPPLPITPQSDPEGEPIGMLQGSLEDMQGRFNLNTLGHYIPAATAQGPTTGAPSASIPDPAPLLQFQRMLVLVGLEPKWAQMAQDWIMANNTSNGVQAQTGDSVYMSQAPPYRSGQFPMTSASELMNLPGFGYERYRKLAPYVTALPDAVTPINICTAPVVVLESLADNLNGELGNADTLANQRKKGCFPDLPTFTNIVGQKVMTALTQAKAVGTTSNYFRLTTRVSLGTSEFTLYSLLTRTPGGKVTPLLRSFGTT